MTLIIINHNYLFKNMYQKDFLQSSLNLKEMQITGIVFLAQISHLNQIKKFKLSTFLLFAPINYK